MSDKETLTEHRNAVKDKDRTSEKRQRKNEEVVNGCGATDHPQ